MKQENPLYYCLTSQKNLPGQAHFSVNKNRTSAEPYEELLLPLTSA